MNYLLINTANEELVIVLSKDGTIFACNERQIKRHNEALLPKLQQVLDMANITLNEVEYLNLINGRRCLVKNENGLYKVFYGDIFVGVGEILGGNLTIKAFIKD